jgi:A32 protein
MINFYKTIKSEKKLNPNEDKHKIHLEFRAIICTASGGGKTNLLTNILYEMSETFHKIYIVTKEKEPLYEMIEERLKDQKNQIKIFYGGKIPDLENLAPLKQQGLIIFDDMVLSQSKEMGEIFIRCRKLGWSAIFISQSYFGIQKLIRQNCNYIWLGRGILERDLKLILSEYSINIPKEKILYLYNKITEKKMHFMMIDLEDRTIRSNIRDIILQF